MQDFLSLDIKLLGRWLPLKVIDFLKNAPREIAKQFHTVILSHHIYRKEQSCIFKRISSSFLKNG